MKRYKVIFKCKYGRSFKYTDIVRAENAQRLEIIKEIPINRLRGLAQAEKERRLVVLSEPMKPMVYKPNDTDTRTCTSCPLDGHCEFGVCREKEGNQNVFSEND